MITYLRPKIDAFAEKLVKKSTILLKVSPNMISLFTIIASLISATLFYNNYYLLGALSLSLGIVDLLDGTVARASNKTSQWGGFLDATIDRTTEVILIFSIGLTGIASWPLCYLAITVSLLISYIKAKAEAGLSISKLGTNKLTIGIIQRTERIIILALSVGLYEFYKGNVFGLNLINLGLLILVILSVLTVIMRLFAIYKLFKEIDSKQK